MRFDSSCPMWCEILWIVSQLPSPSWHFQYRRYKRAFSQKSSLHSSACYNNIDEVLYVRFKHFTYEILLDHIQYNLFDDFITTVEVQLSTIIFWRSLQILQPLLNHFYQFNTKQVLHRKLRLIDNGIFRVGATTAWVFIGLLNESPGPSLSFMKACLPQPLNWCLSTIPSLIEKCHNMPPLYQYWRADLLLGAWRLRCSPWTI